MLCELLSASGSHYLQDNKRNSVTATGRIRSGERDRVVIRAQRRFKKGDKRKKKEKWSINGQTLVEAKENKIFESIIRK